MHDQDIYTITIHDWDKHNANHSQKYKKTLISNNFCTDSRLISLPLSVNWMFLGLLLVCGEHAEGCVKVSGRYLKGLCKVGIRYDKGLRLLQEIQLLTVEKIDFFKERKKERIVVEKKENVFKTGLIENSANKPIVENSVVAFEKQKLDPKSSVAKHHARFHPDAEKWKTFFAKDFYFLNHHLSLVLDRFDSIDEFKDFCTNVINSKSGMKVGDKEAKGYIAGALKIELGIS